MQIPGEKLACVTGAFSLKKNRKADCCAIRRSRLKKQRVLQRWEREDRQRKNKHVRAGYRLGLLNSLAVRDERVRPAEEQ